MGNQAKVYTFEEFSKHNTKNDCWLLIAGKVYNVTKFIDHHPGGVQVMLSATGKDATQRFEDTSHSEATKKTKMVRFHIGEIDASTIPAKERFIPPKKPRSNEDKIMDFIIKLLQFLIPSAILGVAIAARVYTKSE